LSFNGNQYGSDEGLDLSVKGSIHGYSTENAPITVGSNDQIIYADSANALGVAYGASAKSVLTTTGDLLYASGANTLNRLAGSTSGHLLTAQGAGVAPVWAAASGGATWELVARTVTTGTSSAFGVFWDAADACDYYQAWVYTPFSSGTPRRYLSFSTDGSTYSHASVYATKYSIDWATPMTTTGSNVGLSSATGTSGSQFSCFHIQDSDTNHAPVTWDFAVTNSSDAGTTGNAPDQVVYTAGIFGYTGSKIRGIEIWDGGAGTVFAAGASLVVVGLNYS
jgi:hypothetical protein